MFGEDPALPRTVRTGGAALPVLDAGAGAGHGPAQLGADSMLQDVVVQIFQVDVEAGHLRHDRAGKDVR